VNRICAQKASRVSHDDRFDHGRGLNAQAVSGGSSVAMKINTGPEFVSKDSVGIAYSKIP
jgi:hypothetical protein